MSTNSKAIGKLYKGHIVDVYETKGIWAKIDYNGKIGYVHTDYLVTQSKQVKQVENKPVTNPSSSTKQTHVVKKGDTLYRIASNNKTTVSRLKSHNKLTSDHIYIGQKLMIPN